MELDFCILDRNLPRNYANSIGQFGETRLEFWVSSCNFLKYIFHHFHGNLHWLSGIHISVLLDPNQGLGE